MDNAEKIISEIRKTITEIDSPVKLSGLVGHELFIRQQGIVKGLLMAIEIIQKNNV